VELAYGWPGNVGGLGVAGSPSLPAAWYRITQAFDHPGPTWTVPAVGMDPDAELWQRAFVEYLAPTVVEFGVDAVHVDATTLWRWDEQGFFGHLRRSLPAQTAYGEVHRPRLGLLPVQPDARHATAGERRRLR
jgi:hypothetical protein